MQGGNGGMVIDHDGGFRGMAVHSSPYPAVISISIIEKCIDMFMRFKYVIHLLSSCLVDLFMLSDF